MNDMVMALRSGMAHDSDERLWFALVERVVVRENGGLGFETRDGRMIMSCRCDSGDIHEKIR